MTWTALLRGLLAGRPLPRTLVDLVVVAIVLAASLGMLSHGGIGPWREKPARLDLLGSLLIVCSTVPLMAWRRFPVGTFVVTATAAAVLVGLGYPIGLPLGSTVALYLAAASRRSETPWTWRKTATVVGLLLAYLGAATVAQRDLPGMELHTGLAWAAAWFAGERTRLRREQIVELQDRALRAERQAEHERRLAAAEERARIARDLHDSAGHAISVIAIRAGAARLRHRQNPDRLVPALEEIEKLARQTVEEIDELVGTLRDAGSSDGVVRAPLGLASADALIGHHRTAGTVIAFEVSGEPRPLARSADQAAYRILQEALTNAARHGAGSARVELGFGDSAVEIMVTNPVLHDGAPRDGGGHGLIGMRERATLLGGDIDAGQEGRTFRVHARIPYGSHRP